MKKTIAIVGSHPDTRGRLDFDRTDCDIWVFNEALKEEWCKRADGVFQMHLPEIWRSTANRNDPKHYEWLKSNQDVDIYMTEAFEDVPKSIKYPLSDILSRFPTTKRYFTSSVSYALALAIFKGYERIEIYGVEMETGTEYGHQRVGVAYWIGVADGLGIETEYCSDKFFTAPLYGYEGNVRMDMDVFTQRIEQLKPAQKHAQEAHDQAMEIVNELTAAWAADWKTDLSQFDEVITACGQTGHNFGMVDGSMQVNEQYLSACQRMKEETGNYLIVRQELEGNMLAGHNEREANYRELMEVSAQLTQIRKEFDKPNNLEYRQRVLRKFKPLLMKFIEGSTKTGMCTGVFNENRNLMLIHDQILSAQGALDVEPELDMEPNMEQDISVLEADLENMSHYR